VTATTVTPPSAAGPAATRRRTALRSPLLRFLAGRALAGVLILLGITIVAFVLTHLVPGDPALANLGQNATQEQIDSFREVHGLNDPLTTQYLTYLSDLVRGDLGVSQQTHNPVAVDLRAFVPATVELALVAVVLAAFLGVGAGLLAAVYRDRVGDQVVRVISLLGISVPAFWLAILVLYLLFYVLGWFPGGGRLDPDVVPPPRATGMYTVDALLAGQWGTLLNALWHIILPAMVLAVSSVGVLTRYTRTAVLEVIEQDFVRSARAMGLPERTVVVSHVLRAALPSVVTVMGLLFAGIMTGAVLVENIFAWPGIGQYGYHAAVSLDLPAITGVSLFVAVVYLIVNFLVDILYGFLDPRIRVGR
jgi:peptide/nickel transport system permease protein